MSKLRPETVDSIIERKSNSRHTEHISHLIKTYPLDEHQKRGISIYSQDWHRHANELLDHKHEISPRVASEMMDASKSVAERVLSMDHPVINVHKIGLKDHYESKKRSYWMAPDHKFNKDWFNK